MVQLTLASGKKKQFWAHKMTWPIIDARIIVAILKSWITGQVAGPREGKVCRFFLPRCLDAIISSDQKRVHELPHLKMRGVTSCDMIFVPIPFCRKHDIFGAEVAASYRSFVQSLSFKLELGHALYDYSIGGKLRKVSLDICSSHVNSIAIWIYHILHPFQKKI